MSSSESKKVKRRKNKKNDTKPVSNLVTDTRDMDSTANSSKPENDSIENNFQNNAEVLSKLEQMMDATDDPLPALDASQEINPYLSSADKCLICHKEKTTSPACHNQGLESCDDIGLLPCDIGSFSQLPLWVCHDCRYTMEEEQKLGRSLETLKLSSDIRIQPSETPSFSALSSTQPSDVANIVNTCLCPVCKEKRELQHEQEIEVLQLSQCWSELRQAVHQVYQDVGIGYTEERPQVKQPSVEKLKKIVHRLCLRSPHQLFLWLESQGRELVIGMKIKLLKHLSNGAKSPQLAKMFITDMLDDYTKLCSACKKLHPILKELEQDHLKALSLNWELVIRHLFQSLVYLDNRVQYALPSLITQLRSTVDDENEQKQLNALLHKYLIFDEQMTIVAVMWREADPIIQLNMEQAALRTDPQILHEDWDLYKVQRKLLEQQMLKKTEVASHRCSCEDCTLKYMLTCGLLPHTGATQTPPESGIAPLRDTGGHYLSNSFMSSMVNNVDSLESVLCGMPSTIGFPSLKDHCCGSPSSLQSASIGCLKGPCTVENDARFWAQTLPHANGTSEHVSPLPHQHCVLGCPTESVTSETDLSSSTVELHNAGLSSSSLVPTDRICGTGNLGCQCPLCVSAASAPNAGFTEKQTNVPIVEKSSTEHPCECHVCVQHADRATIPTVVSAPPRPAALHLYPHIHGSYAGHTLHNPHVFKPFLPTHVYGVHLPAVPCSKHSFTNPLTDADSAVSHSVLQECLEAYNGSLDLDIVYENAKFLLSSRKCTENVLSVAPVIDNSTKQLIVSEPEVALGTSNVQTPQSPLGSVGCSLAVDVSVKKPLENEITKTASSNSAMVNTAIATHSNKGTQASGPLGCSQALTSLAYSPLDLHHVKPHAHNTVSNLTTNGGTGAAIQEQSATKCVSESSHTSTCVTRPSMVNGKTSLHSCNVTGHHSLTPNKHPCKVISGVADSRYIPPANHCASPLGSACPNQDLDSFPGDTEESVDDSCSEQSSSTSTSNQKDNKHCDCCYCEVFGHDVTALPPVSRNYTEMREKLRQRLNRKKMECKDESNPHVITKAPLEDCRDLDSLISFINGSVSEGREECGSSNKEPSTKVVKKTNKRQKKVESKSHKIGCENEDLTRQSCTCHEVVNETNIVSSSCKPEHLNENTSFIESCNMWANATTASSTNTVGTMTALLENSSISVELAAASSSCESQHFMPPETKVKCVHIDAKKRTCLEKELLCKFKSMTTSESQINAQKEQQVWPIVKSSSEACVGSSTPPLHSQLLASRNSSLVTVSTSSEKSSKKKRKASHQMLPLASTASLSSSSSSGVSSCGSNGSSSKEENFSLNVLTDFKQLQLSLASKKCSSPSPQNGSSATGKKNMAPQTKSNCQLNTFRRYADTPPLSPTTAIDNCKFMDINGHRRHPVVPSRKTSAYFVSNCTDAVPYNSCATNSKSVPPAKLRVRKEDRRKLDSFRNSAVSPYSSLGKSDKLSENSRCKPNGKLHVSSSDLSMTSVKTTGKNKRNKKKQNPSSESSVTDDVFLPRDIDLDNGELDEMERELEAFKRFCWNSVPLANKEKVNVNLKDIIIRKKTELGCS